jgi:hypothetical protein
MHRVSFTEIKMTKNLKVWKLGKKSGIDHEVEFHEIEIQLFQEIKLSIMRLKSLIIVSIS